MKKVTLLFAQSEASVLLDELQTLGMIHIEQQPDDEALPGQMRRRLNTLRKTAAALRSHSTAPVRDDEFDGADADALCALFQQTQVEADRLLAEIELNRKNLALLSPWGAFDAAAIDRLRENGVHISFHILSPAVFAETDFADRHVEVIRETASGVFFVEILIGGGEALCPAEILPSGSAADLHGEIREAEKQIRMLTKRIAGIADRAAVIEEDAENLEHRLERLAAEGSLLTLADGQLMQLGGYIPVSLLAGLQSFLSERCMVSLITVPDEPGRTPIRLKNKPAARLFEPITRIFGLPSYLELDTTPFFAPFFTAFFGMCLADVGYGIIVGLASLAVLIIAKRPAAKLLAKLGLILGAATMAGGLFLNSAWGVSIDGMAFLPPGVLSLLLFRNMDDAMALAILLGLLQISLGLAMQVVNRWRWKGAVHALQPLGTLLLLAGAALWAAGGLLSQDFAIGPLRIGLWVGGGAAGVGMMIGAAGAALIMLFNNPDTRPLLRPLKGLWEMYNILSGVPRDILSYIRLFALSLTGGMLGGAVNLIALMIRGDDPTLLSWFFMLVVLAAGHLINFSLAALGAFVHPLRLTFVEFYNAVGFAGGGVAYKPYGGKKS